jgi:kumamolisin
LKVPRHAKRRRTVAAAAAVAHVPASALTAMIASTAAASPGAATSQDVTVAQGIGTGALKDASVFGTTPSSTKETVSFVLRARNQGQLSFAALHSRGDLSAGEFAREYGQDPRAIAGLQSYLKQFGIISTVYKDNLDVVANGTAGEFDKALSVTQHNYYVPAVKGRDGEQSIPAQHIHGTTQNPRLPRQQGNIVLAVLGLTNYSGFVTDLEHSLGKETTKSTGSDTVYDGSLTPADFEKLYDVDPLYAKGDKGQGTTIGIVTLAALSTSAPTYFWNNVLHLTTKANRVDVVNVDGGPGAPNDNAGSGESDLDVEQSGAIAPDANIVVYQAPNTDSGYADAFYTAASKNVVDTVSTSWGESETYLQESVNDKTESAAYAQAFDQAFEELDVQGQSAFDAAGDSGAYDADSSLDADTTNLVVDNPAGSPYITAGGGTTLGGTVELDLGSSTLNIKIASQRAWGYTYLYPYWNDFGASNEGQFAEEAIGGGGGGYSVLEQTPEYQQGLTEKYSAVEYLVPADYETKDGLTEPTGFTFNANPSVTTGYSQGRAVPDVSANADPDTGYLLYDPLSDPALAGGWGGTSFVAPQMNGVTALIDAYVGHRVGFWNPQIYRFAESRSDPFTPMDASGTGNSNLYYTGTAGSRYNAGTGLGYPDVYKLAKDFADSQRVR